MYRFRLKSATMAVEQGGASKILAVVPAGAEIAARELPDIHSGYGCSTLVAIEWNGKTVSMFLADVLERGERLEWG